MKTFFTELETLYEEVTAALPRVEGNPCGDCRACCSVRLKVHWVPRLEIDYLNEKIGPERTELFRRYLDREVDEEGEFRFEYCPLLEDYGCSIHPYRPYSARMYGFYRSEDRELLPECLFRGTETVVPAAQLAFRAPHSLRFLKLVLDYEAATNGEDPELLEAQAKLQELTLDRVFFLQANQQHQEALEQLQDLLQKSQNDPLLHQVAGELHEALNNRVAAVEAFSDAVALDPSNAEVWYRLANNLFFTGRVEQALNSAERASSLMPESSKVHGFLGFIKQQQGDLNGARDLYRWAVSSETEPGPYRFQLGFILHQLGNLDAARKALESALDFAPTKTMAEELLRECSQETIGD